MHHFIASTALSFFISFAFSRNVPCGPNRSIDNPIDCVDQQPSSNSNENFNQDFTPQVYSTRSIFDASDANDKVVDDALTTTQSFVKRESMGKTVDSSSSQELEGSGSNGVIPIDKSNQSIHLDNSTELNFNPSQMNDNSTLNSFPIRVENGKNDTVAAVSLNAISTIEEDKIVILKQKIQQWQNAVENYLHATYRLRKRRQTNWSRLFPSTTSSGYDPGNTGKTPSSFMAVAGNAMGDALKPAMDLMTQGVDLLSDLYSTQLTKSRASTFSVVTGQNDTVAAEQFRDNLQQLQKRLGDLGDQLQRVVDSFQHMQVPFFDSIFSTGLFSLDSPTAKKPEGKSSGGNVKSKTDKV